MKIILTGSEGLMGKQLFRYLNKNNKILKLDKILGDGKKRVWDSEMPAQKKLRAIIA